MQHQAQPSHPIFSFANAEMGPVASRFIQSVEKISGQPKIKKLYFDYIDDNRPAADFWADALDRLGISIDLSQDRDASIPRTGSTLIIANHPYGVIDGLVLCALVSKVRQDYKIITHRVLRQAPATMDKILPIDFDETEAALRNNLAMRKEAETYLRAGHVVIIFPAGAISLAPKLVDEAVNAEWKNFAAKLATQPDTVTVPFRFDGQNSVLYMAARKMSMMLGYSLMFREIVKLMGTKVSLTMRQRITAKELKALGTRSDITRYLRRKTYGE